MLTIGLVSCLDDFETPLDQYDRELLTIDEYIEENGIPVEIDDRTGIRYNVTAQGFGVMPFNPDSVTISYTTQVISNLSQFDAGNSLKVPWNALGDGAKQSLTKLREGGTVRSYVPSLYGANGVIINRVPPIAEPMLFTISLERVHSKQLLADINTIKNTVEELKLENVVEHPSGVFYILNQGTGKNASSVASINATYSGRVLGEDSDFISQSEVELNITNAILGWQIVMPLIKEGGDIKFYVPSPLALGVLGENTFNIPPNAILEFDLKLLKVN